jgi:hypothetical protein
MPCDGWSISQVFGRIERNASFDLSPGVYKGRGELERSVVTDCEFHGKASANVDCRLQLTRLTRHLPGINANLLVVNKTYMTYSKYGLLNSYPIAFTIL